MTLEDRSTRMTLEDPHRGFPQCTPSLRILQVTGDTTRLSVYFSLRMSSDTKGAGRVAKPQDILGGGGSNVYVPLRTEGDPRRGTECTPIGQFPHRVHVDLVPCRGRI